MDVRDLVEVYRAQNSIQAQFLKQMLADAGIHARIENELLQGVIGAPEAWFTAPRIMVQSTDLPRAIEVFARSEQSVAASRATSNNESEADNCLACGARMANEDDECPACGWSYGREQEL